MLQMEILVLLFKTQRICYHYLHNSEGLGGGGVLESVKYEALLSAISQFRKSQMSANSYSQPTVRILTKKPWTVTFNSSSNCLVIINRLMEILCINKVIVSWAVKRHKNKARQISSAEGASR